MSLPKYYRGTMVGHRNGRIIVTADAGKDDQGRRLVAIDCDCGTKGMVVLRTYVQNGDRVSCGCRHRECTTGGTNRRTHSAKSYGQTLPEYCAWQHMKDRCHNPNNKHWDRYGGRGISVCAEWRDSFESFIRHVGSKPSSKHTIDRINNDGNYEPGNVRWATAHEQAKNRRSTRWLTHEGRTQNVTDWAKEIGMLEPTLRTRLEDGWSLMDALSTPTRRPAKSAIEDELRQNPQKTNREIAAAFDVGAAFVSGIRLRLGIPSPTAKQWHPAQDAIAAELLAHPQRPDTLIAAKHGASPWTIASARKRLGIPPTGLRGNRFYRYSEESEAK